MTRGARTVTAVLLCMVVIGALAMVIVALPAAASVSEPIEVSLDFDAFVPGARQTRQLAVDVPVRSNVTEAGVVRSTGIASDIDWTFELCRRAACRPLAAGAEVEPGAYTLQVSAMLDVASGKAGDGLAGDGEVIGRILLVEAQGPAAERPSYLIWLTMFATVLVALGAFVVHRVRGVPV